MTKARYFAGTCYFKGKEYDIYETEFHVPDLEGVHVVLMGFKGPDTAMLWGGAELVLFKSIAELSGKTIHVHADGESYEDDDLGTDIIGANSFTECTAWSFGNKFYLLGDIKIDFEHLRDNKFRCYLECQLVNVGEEEDEIADLPTEAFSTATAVFAVDIDQEDVQGWGE